MKTKTALYLLLLLFSHLSYSQDNLAENLKAIYKSHNDLYFSRLYFNQLVDSIIKRNLANCEKRLANVKIDKNNIAFKKYLAEYYFLKSALSVKERNSLKVFHLADSSKFYLKQINSSFINADEDTKGQCFIDDCALKSLQYSIEQVEDNMNSLNLERIFSARQPYDILATESLIRQFHEISRESKMIYGFIKSSYFIEKKQCDSAAIYYNLTNTLNKLVLADNINDEYIPLIFKNNDYTFEKKLFIKQCDDRIIMRVLGITN
jgi:hypothetical protein